MKVRCYRVEPNDDGTFQVTVDVISESRGVYCGDELKFSATSLEDVVSKMKAAEKKVSMMKEKKKKGKGKGQDKSLSGFFDAEYEDED